MWAATEAASSRTCVVVSLLGVFMPTPARCLIFDEVIGDGGRAGVLGGLLPTMSFSLGLQVRMLRMRVRLRILHCNFLQ
jgi:hypothetical protein